MKKTDIALLIVVVSISGALTYWIAHATIGQANNSAIPVKVIRDIDDAQIKIDPAVFMKDGINPTVETTITGVDLTSLETSNDEQKESSDDAAAGLQSGLVAGDSVDAAGS